MSVDKLCGSTYFAGLLLEPAASNLVVNYSLSPMLVRVFLNPTLSHGSAMGQASSLLIVLVISRVLGLPIRSNIGFSTLFTFAQVPILHSWVLIKCVERFSLLTFEASLQNGTDSSPSC
jgi:hypothetical protein